MQEQQKPGVIMPKLLETPVGIVTVYGHELVSERDLEILRLCLCSVDNHYVKMVVFNGDGRPSGNLARMTTSTNSYVINLKYTVKQCVENTKTRPEIIPASILKAVNMNIIISHLHEIRHMIQAEEDFVAGKLRADKEAEEDANVFSLRAMYNLAMEHDLQPPIIQDCPYVNQEILAALTDPHADSEWAEFQQHMYDDGLMWEEKYESIEHRGVTLHRFNDYIELMEENSIDYDPDAKWKNSSLRACSARGYQEQPPASKVDIAVKVHTAVTDPPVAEPVVPADFPEADIKPPMVTKSDVPVQPAVMNTMVGAHTTTGIADYGEIGLDILDTGDQEEDVEDDMFSTGGMSTEIQQAPMATQQVVAAPIVPTEPIPAWEEPEAREALAANTDKPVQAQEQVAVYPPTGYDKATTSAIANGIFNKIYNHIFCGPSARTLNSDISFEDPKEIVTVPIPLTEAEKTVLVSARGFNKWGHFSPQVTPDDGLRGSLTIDKRLPQYQFCLNDNGHKVMRKLIPQNPAKRNPDGQYSKPAMEARGGTCIMYIFEDDQKVLQANPGSRYEAGKIKDGVRIYNK